MDIIYSKIWVEIKGSVNRQVNNQYISYTKQYITDFIRIDHNRSFYQKVGDLSRDAV